MDHLGSPHQDRLHGIPFRHLPHGVRKHLAMKLNIPSGTDWRDVAEKCGYTATEIKYIQSLKLEHGCFTLKLFGDLDKKEPTVYLDGFYMILHSLGRVDATLILDENLSEIYRAHEQEQQQQKIAFYSQQQNQTSLQGPPSINTEQIGLYKLVPRGVVKPNTRDSNNEMNSFNNPSHSFSSAGSTVPKSYVGGMLHFPGDPQADSTTRNAIAGISILSGESTYTDLYALAELNANHAVSLPSHERSAPPADHNTTQRQNEPCAPPPDHNTTQRQHDDAILPSQSHHMCNPPIFSRPQPQQNNSFISEQHTGLASNADRLSLNLTVNDNYPNYSYQDDSTAYATSLQRITTVDPSTHASRMVLPEVSANVEPVVQRIVQQPTLNVDRLPPATRGPLFITYDLGPDGKTKMALASLKSLFENNRFPMSFDPYKEQGERTWAYNKHMAEIHFKEAKFVIILVTPTYNTAVLGKPTICKRGDDIHQTNVQLIYHWILNRLNNKPRTQEVVVVLADGAVQDDIPNNIRQCCTPFFTFPQDCRKLIDKLKSLSANRNMNEQPVRSLPTSGSTNPHFDSRSTMSA